MDKGDAVRFVAIADWLSDLPDVYCLAIWKERATEDGFADHEDSPYRVMLVAGDRDEGQQQRYEGTHPSSIYGALQRAVDSMLTDDVKAEIAALDRGGSGVAARIDEHTEQRLEGHPIPMVGIGDMWDKIVSRFTATDWRRLSVMVIGTSRNTWPLGARHELASLLRSHAHGWKAVPNMAVPESRELQHATDAAIDQMHQDGWVPNRHWVSRWIKSALGAVSAGGGTT